MDKKRLIFMDVLRLGAFFLVFFYHFLVRASENGMLMPEIAQNIYEHSNFHMATLGVSLFFMISGTGLALSAEKEWDVKKYYKRRITRIYVPYYLAYAGIFIAMVFVKGSEVFDGNIPAVHFIFTIAGIDGYLKEFGIETFSLGIGEWFLGCLLLMYLIFPLLWKLIKKQKKIMGGILFCLYLVCCMIGHTNIPVHMNFFVKLFEFVLGMYFVINQDVFRKYAKGIAVAAIVIFVCMIGPAELPLPEGICITVFASAVFLIVSYAEPIWRKMDKRSSFLRIFGKYSFEMYLIHHWVIIALTTFLGGKMTGMSGMIALFMLELLVTILGAVVLKNIANGVFICYNKILKI